MGRHPNLVTALAGLTLIAIIAFGASCDARSDRRPPLEDIRKLAYQLEQEHHFGKPWHPNAKAVAVEVVSHPEPHLVVVNVQSDSDLERMLGAIQSALLTIEYSRKHLIFRRSFRV